MTRATGKPAGEPVAETSDSAVDAIAEAAAAARPGWEAMGPAGRAAALRAVANALDAQAGELATVADTETALGSARLTGEVARTTGQLRMFADVLEDGGYLDLITSPPAQGVPGLRRMVRPLGPVAVLLGVELPFRVLSRGGRHRVGAGGWLPGGGESPRRPPADLGRDPPAS